MSEPYRIWIDGQALPVRPERFNPTQPVAILPVKITWGKTEPWSEHNASTLDVTLAAEKPGWSNGVDLIGLTLAMGWTDEPVWKGLITGCGIRSDRDRTYYALQASDLTQLLAKTKGTPANNTKYQNGRMDYSSLTPWGIGIGQDAPAMAYDDFEFSVFFGFSDAMLADKENVLDAYRDMHLWRSNGTYLADLWSYFYILPEGDNGTLQWESGYIQGNVTLESNGSIQTGSTYFGDSLDGYDVYAAASDYTVADTEFKSPDLYTGVKWTSWRQVNGEWKHDSVTTIDATNQIDSRLSEYLSIDTDDPAAPGGTVAVGYPVRRDVLQAQIDRITSAPRLPSLSTTVITSAAITPRLFFFLGCRWENGFKGISGFYKTVAGTATLDRRADGTVGWSNDFSLFPVPLIGAGTATVRDFKTSGYARNRYKPPAGDYIRPVELGILRAVTRFEK